MSNVRPDPVEEWAPMFLYFPGGGVKFTKEQVLNESFAIFNGHCKLCDSRLAESAKEHMRKHRRDLTAWLARRRSEAAKKSLAGLATARKEKALAKETINEPKEDDDE